MDENKKLAIPKNANQVFCSALIHSALSSAEQAVKFGVKKNKIVLSAKVSNVVDLVYVYRAISNKASYPLHLGLTEAGFGTKGAVSTSVALGVLLSQGIGDTIRASITPTASRDRTYEVKLCQQILQSLGLQFYSPEIISCPGCGRTSSKFFQKLATSVQNYIEANSQKWPQEIVKKVKIAVMGCIVNGPGESKNADIGISLPGDGETPIAVIYIEGNKSHTIRGDNIEKQFLMILDKYMGTKANIFKLRNNKYQL